MSADKGRVRGKEVENSCLILASLTAWLLALRASICRLSFRQRHHER